MDSADTGVWEDGDGGLMARRKRLRAFVDTVLDTMEALPPPDTYLEAERALKAAKAADKVYTQLNNAPRRPNWTDYDPCVRDRAPHQTSAPKVSPVWSHDPDLDDDEREALGMASNNTPASVAVPARRRVTLGDLDALESIPVVTPDDAPKPVTAPLPDVGTAFKRSSGSDPDRRFTGSAPRSAT